MPTNDKPRMEQGTLFDLPAPEPSTPTAIHPSPPSKPKPKPIAPAPEKEALKPYVPRHIPYADFLKMFNGISELALYWFNKQALKE